MLKKNDIIQVQITGMTAEGNGVAKVNGMAVFVPFTAVGDVLQIRIVKLMKNYAYAIVESMLTPSEDRCEPDCSVYHRCGGCSFRHLTYEAELRHKWEFVRDNLQRIGKLEIEPDPIVPSPKESGYRNKAQYPVGVNEKGEVVMGFYAKRSHRVIHCMDCALQPPEFLPILEVIKTFLEEKQIPIYDELLHEGVVRHVYLRLAEVTGEIMVCLVINANRLPDSEELVRRLTEHSERIKTIVLNRNKAKTNIILSDRNTVIYGDGFITDELCGIRVKISPLSFYQVNRSSAENLYRLAKEMAGLTGKETVLDLYCGTGTIGLTMAKDAKELIGVEIVPQAIEDAKDNAQQNGITNAQFLCADAGAAAVKLALDEVKPDVIIVDPPRKGCSSEVLNAISLMEPQRIVMISCNSATMARDCQSLKGKGYEVRRVVPVDMFPRTGHVECVVLMSKVQK